MQSIRFVSIPATISRLLCRTHPFLSVLIVFIVLSVHIVLIVLTEITVLIVLVLLIAFVCIHLCALAVTRHRAMVQ